MRKVTVCLVVTVLLLLFFSVRVSDYSWVVPKPHSHTLSVSHITEDRESEGPQPTRKILLMTYGRSGSTFTSHLIQQDPGVFYTFEPLYGLAERHSAKRGPLSKVLTHESEARAEQYNQHALEIMDSFLNCRFESLDVSDIKNYQLRNSVDSRLLWGCTQKRTEKWTASQVIQCFLDSRKVCLSRPVKMVKTIRFRGTAARQLLAKYKDLKLIYLIRDPRGTLASQRRVFRTFTWAQTGNFSKDYCQIFREDLAVVGKLMDTYPHRVRLFRYETLAQNPMNMSERVYNFLGLKFTPAVKEWIYNNTMAGNKSNNAYGTLRSNSTETAFSWRSKIPLESAMAIDRNCKDIYDSLGYIPVTNHQELTDPFHNLLNTVDFHGHKL